MENLTCLKCGNVGHDEKEAVDSLGRKHIKASCSKCGSYIKFLSTGKAFKFYFGKYAGKELKDVPVDYLSWCISNKVKGWEKIKIYLDGTIK